MSKTKLCDICFENINAFNFMIKRSSLNRENHTHQIELHSHKQLEIYINLSGDVSFLVNNNLYPVSQGDIIISRPNELHHCIYRSEKQHEFFWILIDIEQNNKLFDAFLKDIHSNHISPYQKKKEKIIEICKLLLENRLDIFEQYLSLFKLADLIKSSANRDSHDFNTLPDDLICVLDYIDEHISENIKISDISNSLFISKSTIERRFKAFLDMKPLEFIQKKKMLYAARLLQNGESVLSAGLGTGYSDNSYFINLFKRYHKITPFEYKKRYL